MRHMAYCVVVRSIGRSVSVAPRAGGSRRLRRGRRRGFTSNLVNGGGRVHDLRHVEPMNLRVASRRYVAGTLPGSRPGAAPELRPPCPRWTPWPERSRSLQLRPWRLDVAIEHESQEQRLARAVRDALEWS